MPIRSIAQLKKWFAKAKYPTESQFADLIDSFLHKEEDKVTINEIENLPEILNEKYTAADGQELEGRVDDLEKAIPPLKESITRGDTQTLESAKDYTDDREVVIMEKVDTKVDTKVDKVTGMGLSQASYTTSEKTKLAGIAPNANNYSHPNDANTRHVTDTQIADWDAKAGTDVATIQTDGLMSAADKAKVDNMSGGTTIDNVTITNFDTFIPDDDPIVSALVIGESCNFNSDMAIGYPSPGSFYTCAGIIKRISADTYKLIAISVATPSTAANVAVRTYRKGYNYVWQLQTPYTSSITTSSGWSKHPDRRLEQWGVITLAGNSTVSVALPTTFENNSYSVFFSLQTSASTLLAGFPCAYNVLSNQFSIAGNGSSSTSISLRWRAIGTY